MLLQDKTVLFIGVGTGGAHAAVEMAKCGVGRFILVDRDRLSVGNVKLLINQLCIETGGGGGLRWRLPPSIWRPGPSRAPETIALPSVLRRCHARRGL